jgi:hypothetical protein
VCGEGGHANCFFFFCEVFVGKSGALKQFAGSGWKFCVEVF